MQTEEIVAAVVGTPFLIMAIIMGVAVIMMFVGIIVAIIKAAKDKYIDNDYR